MATAPEPGTVFPPRDVWDIAAYDPNELIAGFLDHRPDDPEPGPNRSPSFRWGWSNRRRDMTGAPDDGYDALRHAYLRMMRRAN